MDLAFLRFTVFDADTNYMICQRVVPLKCLRPGYRHIRLRSPSNKPLQMASLLIFSRSEQEGCGSSRKPTHFLTVYGVTNTEPYTILKISEDTTVEEVSVEKQLNSSGNNQKINKMFKNRFWVLAIVLVEAAVAAKQY